MSRQTWLADHLRAWGLPVVEIDDWETLGSSIFSPAAMVVHHTAGPARGDYPSLWIVRNGRRDLPGPLSQVGLGRSGRVYVIAAGRANHAGGRYDIGWNGVSGNTRRFGCEAESVGTRDDWTVEQRRNYPLLCAALLDHIGAGADMLCGHKETATNKIDPAYWDMDDMRAQVAAHLARGPQGQEEFDMGTITEERLREIIRAEIEHANRPHVRKASDGPRHYLVREDEGVAIYITDPGFLTRMASKFGVRSDMTDADIRDYYEVIE